MNLLEKVLALETEAAEFGFAWENAEQIMDQIRSECVEVTEHLNTQNRSELQEEIGDLLHAVFSLSVFCGLNPQETLQQTVEKFEKRLRAVKSIAQNRGLATLRGHPFDELMAIWREAKSQVG